MPSQVRKRCRVGATPALLAAIAMTEIGCSGSSNTSTPPPQPLTCSNPGAATSGPVDMHCEGVPPQTVSAASCHAGPDGSADAGDADGGAGGDQGCPYGATMFGHEGSDDDCKYRLTWTSTSICEGFPGVTFTVTLVNNADGSLVTDLPPTEGIIGEAFIPTDPNAACDDVSMHGSPTPSIHFLETSATSGIYVGNVIFDKAGDWTVRFHMHEECYDLLDDSPHGHAAFRVTAP